DGFGEQLLLGRRDSGLDDPLDVPALVADDPAIRVVGPDLSGKDRERGMTLGEQRAQARERLRTQQRGIAVDDVCDATAATRFRERDAYRITGPPWRILQRDSRISIEHLPSGLALLGKHDQRPRAGRAIARVLLGGLFAPLDQFRDPTTAFAAELRVALATQLRLARLAALSAELGISARPELRLARFSAFAAELRVTLGPELAFAGLAAATTDLSIKRRAVLARGRCSAPLPRLTDGW